MADQADMSGAGMSQEQPNRLTKFDVTNVPQEPATIHVQRYIEGKLVDVDLPSALSQEEVGSLMPAWKQQRFLESTANSETFRYQRSVEKTEPARSYLTYAIPSPFDPLQKNALMDRNQMFWRVWWAHNYASRKLTQTQMSREIRMALQAIKDATEPFIVNPNFPPDNPHSAV